MRPLTNSLERGYRQPVRPVLKPSHPLCRGLTGCFVLNDASGGGSAATRLRNIGTSGAIGDHALLATNPWVSSHHGGVALGFNNAGNGSINTTSILEIDGAKPRSIAFWVRQTTITTIKGLFSITGAATALRHFQIYAGALVNGDLRIQTSGCDWNSTGALLVNATWAHVVATYNGGAAQTAGNIKLYFNGAAAAIALSGVSTGVLNTHAGANTGFGYDSNVGGRLLTGAMEGIRVYNRELDPAEVQWLYSEPYAGVVSAPILSRTGVPFVPRLNTLTAPYSRKFAPLLLR